MSHFKFVAALQCKMCVLLYNSVAKFLGSYVMQSHFYSNYVAEMLSLIYITCCRSLTWLNLSHNNISSASFVSQLSRLTGIVMPQN